MSTFEIDYLKCAHEHWLNGNASEAGRLVFEKLTLDLRPRWACRILELALKRTALEPDAILRILHIGDHPSEWKEAHTAFSSARRQLLQLDKRKAKTADEFLLSGLLVLAEFVAKVLYNSTNPSDAFDEDSGWFVVASAKYICNQLDDPQFSQLMWSTIADFAPAIG